MPDPAQPKKSSLTWIIVLAVIIVAGAAVYFAFGNKPETTNTNTKANTNTVGNANVAANANTNVNSGVDLAQYDGKIVNIASIDGKVTGQLAMAYRPAEPMPLQVVSFLKVKDDLPKTAIATGGTGYQYIASHAPAAAIRTSDRGVLSAVFCNASQMPDILALAQTGSVTVDTYGGCADQYSFTALTDTFYNIYSEYYNQYDFDYSRLLGKDTLALFDSGPYWKPDLTTGGSAYDIDEVLADAAVARQYTLTYSE